MKIDIKKLVTKLRESDALNVHVSFNMESEKRTNGSARNDLFMATLGRQELLSALGDVDDDSQD